MTRGAMFVALEGEESAIKSLLNINEIARREMEAATRDSTAHVHERIAEEILDPSKKTGRIYTHRYARGRNGGIFPTERRSKPHQASARGQYPASDTGNLVRQLWDEVDAGLAGLDGDMSAQLSMSLEDQIEEASRFVGSVGCDASYAKPLEYKDPGNGGRPFMRRGLMESEDFIWNRFLQIRGKFSS